MSAPPQAAAARYAGMPSLVWAALGVLAFSLTFPATVLAERSFNALVVGAGRSVIAAVIAAICLRVRRVALPARADWPGLIAVALGCGIGFGVLSALALHHTTSSHGAVVVGLLPAATAAVAVISVGDRPGPAFWGASLIGTATVTAYALSRGAGTLRGADLLLLASVMVAAVGYAEGGRLTRKMPGWQVVGWGLVIAFPISLVLTLVGVAHSSAPHLTAPALLGLGYVGSISTFVGFFAWYRGLAEAGVAKASQVQLAQPLLTIGWSVPLLGEHLDPLALGAAVIVGICVLVTQRTRVSHRDNPRPTPTGRDAR
ncbi:MAG TPA: DMT family transporter [Solirubrobacteraceae bacterium]|jgi:drug/metabolite transporter (DMT)-like permease